jgi:hypothetical protein
MSAPAMCRKHHEPVCTGRRMHGERLHSIGKAGQNIDRTDRNNQQRMKDLQNGSFPSGRSASAICSGGR